MQEPSTVLTLQAPRVVDGVRTLVRVSFGGSMRGSEPRSCVPSLATEIAADAVPKQVLIQD